jgi:hypothetical protein
MKNDVRIVTDPLGNTIYLTQGCVDSSKNGESESYDDDVSKVIQKPSMLFHLEEDSLKKMFYFRLVGWHKTMLIIVNLQQDKWESTHCILNPPNDLLSQLMQKGTQLI